MQSSVRYPIARAGSYTDGIAPSVGARRSGPRSNQPAEVAYNSTPPPISAIPSSQRNRLPGGDRSDSPDGLAAAGVGECEAPEEALRVLTPGSASLSFVIRFVRRWLRDDSSDSWNEKRRSIAAMPPLLRKCRPWLLVRRRGTGWACLDSRRFPFETGPYNQMVGAVLPPAAKDRGFSFLIH